MISMIPLKENVKNKENEIYIIVEKK